MKSLRGLGVASAEIDPLGAVGDRRFLVVDPAGNFLTQRTVPRMALVDALIDAASLTLRCDGFEDLRVRRRPDPAAPLMPVRVWASEGLDAEDCGEAAAQWLTRVLRGPCRLVRIGPAFHRPVTKKARRDGDIVSFADSCPFLVTSEASLGDLNRRIEKAGGGGVPMERFRPNLVLSGCGPYEEDTWKRIRIGAIEFRSAGPCTRCVITLTDHRTGVREKEPLRTLATYRRDAEDSTDVDFGQNLLHDPAGGVLRVGDPVVVLE